jgi:hypothetical protein
MAVAVLGTSLISEAGRSLMETAVNIVIKRTRVLTSPAGTLPMSVIRCWRSPYGAGAWFYAAGAWFYAAGAALTVSASVGVISSRQAKIPERIKIKTAG